MKKRVFSLVLLLMLLLTMTLPVLADGNEDLDFITDYSGLLTPEEWTSLNNYAVDLYEYYDCGVYLIIVDDYQEYGSDMESACDYLYMNYELGSSNDYSAILLLMSMSARDWHLRSYGDFGKETLTTHGGEKMAEKFLPYLGENDWYGGFAAYLQECGRYLDAAASGHPLYGTASIFFKYFAISLVPGALIALLVCSILKSRMKTAQKKTEAKDYILDDGITIRSRSDVYTHTTTTRTKIEHESSSSGGGGSRSSSGGCSTGGKF